MKTLPLHFKQDEKGIYQYENKHNYTENMDKKVHNLAKLINASAKANRLHREAQSQFSRINQRPGPNH